MASPMYLIQMVLLVAQVVMALHRQHFKKKKELIVMVRSYNPMPGMLARMHEFSEDIRMNAPHVQFVVSIDYTNGNYSSNASKIKTELPDAMIHKYTWADVLANYPVYRQPELVNASGYLFHMEPVFLAVNYVKNHARIADNASVWVFEDDVFFCNVSISEFIKLYDNVTSDFLGQTPVDVSGWMHANFSSDKFLDKFDSGSRWHNFEHVERFSSKFLAYLEKESVTHRVTSLSEMFAPTECWNKRHIFKCQEFSPQHLGKYGWWYLMNESTATATCREANGTTVNHAAKFVS